LWFFSFFSCFSMSLRSFSTVCWMFWRGCDPLWGFCVKFWDGNSWKFAKFEKLIFLWIQERVSIFT
jgi:hypothetical protein